MESDRPTLDEIATWPATVDVPTAAAAFGISRSHAYVLARRGEFPATVLTVGGRMKVTTSSIIAALRQ
jgi:predicted DNA-binding transcriptional regulator AlpA